MSLDASYELEEEEEEEEKKEEEGKNNKKKEREKEEGRGKGEDNEHRRKIVNLVGKYVVACGLKFGKIIALKIEKSINKQLQLLN